MDRFGVRRTIRCRSRPRPLAVALTPAMAETWQLVLLWGVVVGSAAALRRLSRRLNRGALV